ncbi:MAG: alpha/beta hydrolase [Chloroflexota bacterium]
MSSQLPVASYQQQISTIEIDSIKIVQKIAGEGLPVLLLHGWGANISLVWPLAERLVTLGYKVYVLDLPGFGDSENPPAAWSVHDYVNFVLAYLDYYQLDKIYLFGHSFGGRLSLVLGAEHPERIIKMALADSAGVREKPSSSGQMRLKTFRFVQNSLRKIGMSGQADNLREWYTDKYGSADYKAAKGIMRETFVKVVNEDLLPFAARVKPSTLLFWGDQDADTPLSQGQLLEKTIPDAGLVVWEGAGHYSYLERLADTARVMDHFFRN